MIYGGFSLLMFYILTIIIGNPVGLHYGIDYLKTKQTKKDIYLG